MPTSADTGNCNSTDVSHPQKQNKFAAEIWIPRTDDVSRRSFIQLTSIFLAGLTIPILPIPNAKAAVSAWPLQVISRAALLRLVQRFVLRTLAREAANIIADYAIDNLIDPPPPWPATDELADFHNSFRSCWAFPKTMIPTQVGTQNRFVRVDNFCRCFDKREYQSYSDWNHIELARVQYLREEQNDDKIVPIPRTSRLPMNTTYVQKIERYSDWVRPMVPELASVLTDAETKFFYARRFIIPRVRFSKRRQVGIAFNHPNYGDNFVFVPDY